MAAEAAGLARLTETIEASLPGFVEHPGDDVLMNLQGLDRLRQSLADLSALLACAGAAIPEDLSLDAGELLSMVKLDHFTRAILRPDSAPAVDPNSLRDSAGDIQWL